MKFIAAGLAKSNEFTSSHVYGHKHAIEVKNPDAEGASAKLSKLLSGHVWKDAVDDSLFPHNLPGEEIKPVAIDQVYASNHPMSVLTFDYANTVDAPSPPANKSPSDISVEDALTALAIHGLLFVGAQFSLTSSGYPKIDCELEVLNKDSAKQMYAWLFGKKQI